MPRKKNPNTGYVKPDYHANNKKQNDDNSQEKKKKVKLRTSFDIYNRLMHDKTLGIDLNHVRIGYMDKMENAIVELEISKWKMIEKGGDIPMHCVVYFVLTMGNGKTLKIWDRETRLDRLYCSGNTDKTQSIRCILDSQQIEQIQTQRAMK